MGKVVVGFIIVSPYLYVYLRVKLDSRTFVAMADSAACKTFRVK